MQSKLVNALKLAFCLLPLFLLWNVHPADGLSRSSMHILAVFLSVILSLLLSDLKISVIVMVALLVLAFTQSFQCTTVDGIKVDCRRCQREIRPVPHLSFDGYNYTVTTEMPVSVYDVYQCDGMKQSFSIALSGFALPLSWLVLCSFQIGKAVERTGLGRRLSLILVRHLGGSILGLGYSLFASELILGPFLPSNTARGAGIIMPVVVSLARVLGSTPTASPTIGRFLILCGSHANLLISSIYMTATVANPLVSEHAADILGIKFDFPTWVLGSVVPGVFLILVLPPILAYICGAAEYDGTAVRHSAKTELESLGKLTWRECQLIMVVWVCLILWIMNILPEAFVAMTGLAMLLCMGTIQWEDVASNSQAWDAFFWLSGMVLIAEQLTALGLTRWFGRWCGDHFRDGHNPVRASIGLSSFYFFSMYFFSSLTGHIVAFVGPLMEAGKSLEVPPFLLTALLAYFSSLSGCLTNYSSGPPVVYFSQGYFKQSQWFLIGLGLACLYWLVYLTLGLAWWKWLGWF
ncbi:Sodium/sulfate symporter [Zopfochytrium polystomum]|nr:Sodium/sulfate symporter [Zopfochytrium polystomum]